MSGRDTVSTSPALQAAAAAWRALAGPLAARRSMRVWRGPDRGYDQVRRLATVTLPVLPAALPLFTKAGWTRTLALDFDLKGGSRAELDHDVNDAVALVTAAGGSVIVDRSPAGGHHVWIPLWTEHRLDTLVPLLRAMRTRWSTLDTTPMTNVAAGCLTGPGSACIEGGHRELVTPLDHAIEAARTRSPQGTLGELRNALIRPPRRDTTPTSDIEEGDPASESTAVREDGAAARDDRQRPRGGQRKTPQDALAPDLHAFAVTGSVPASRIGWTRSEARMGVLAQAARAGLSAAEVQDCITSGAWGGMAAAYDKYGARWTHRFQLEWAKAKQFVIRRPAKSQDPEHKQPLTGGTAWQQQWLAQALHWLSHRKVPSTSPSTAAAVLQALSYIAWLTDSRHVSPGGRWLSIAAGMLTEATVWLTLRALTSVDGCPFRLVTRHHGPHADTYELITPTLDNLPVVVTATEIRRVRVRKVPAVWKTIGHGAREVFEIIENMTSADTRDASAIRLRKADIKRVARSSPSAVNLALARLAAFGLIETGWGWVRRTPRSLTDVARDHNVRDHVDKRLARHRAERRTWQMLLNLWSSALAVDCPDVERLPADPLNADERDAWLQIVLATGPPPDPYAPSPQELQVSSAISLFRAELGAVTLARPRHRAGEPHTWDHPLVTLAADGTAGG